MNKTRHLPTIIGRTGAPTSSPQAPPDSCCGQVATVQQALDAALAQIRQRDYAAVLRERGASPVHELGAVFDGKRAWVRVGEAGVRRGRIKPPG